MINLKKLVKILTVIIIKVNKIFDIIKERFNMNYTEFAIDDIFSNDIEDKMILPFLKGVFKSSSEIELLKNKTYSIKFLTHQISSLWEIGNYFKKLYNTEFVINYETIGDLNKKTIFIGQIENKTAIRFLEDIKVASFDKNNKLIKVKENNIFITQEEEIAFLKGVFAISGNIYFPEIEEQSNYHLEFVLQDLKTAKQIESILEKYKISIKIQETVEKTQKIYLKDSQRISDFLALIGAFETVLKLQDLLINKSIRNQVNRETNCFMGNLKKLMKASEEQINSIKYILETNKDLLDDKLLVVAKARLENQNSSLEELSNILNLSKSCIRHRLDKIKEIQKNIRKENE